MVRESGSIRVMMIFPSLSPSRTAHVLPCQRIHAMPFSMDIIFIPATGEGAFFTGECETLVVSAVVFWFITPFSRVRISSS